MHIDNVIFLILSKNAYTKFSAGPATDRPTRDTVFLDYANNHSGFTDEFSPEGGLSGEVIVSVSPGTMKNVTYYEVPSAPDLREESFLCRLLIAVFYLSCAVAYFCLYHKTKDGKPVFWHWWDGPVLASCMSAIVFLVLPVNRVLGRYLMSWIDGLFGYGNYQIDFINLNEKMLFDIPVRYALYAAILMGVVLLIWRTVSDSFGDLKTIPFLLFAGLLAAPFTYRFFHFAHDYIFHAIWVTIALYILIGHIITPAFTAITNTPEIGSSAIWIYDHTGKSHHVLFSETANGAEITFVDNGRTMRLKADPIDGDLYLGDDGKKYSRSRIPLAP